jgi:hypothetical protein
MPFLRLPKMNCLLTTNRLTMCRCQSRWSRAKPSFGFETCHCVDAKPSPESRKCHCLHAKLPRKVGNAIVCTQSLPGKSEKTLFACKTISGISDKPLHVRNAFIRILVWNLLNGGNRS